jgi:hypothetical protein
MEELLGSVPEEAKIRGGDCSETSESQEERSAVKMAEMRRQAGLFKGNKTNSMRIVLYAVVLLRKVDRIQGNLFQESGLMWNQFERFWTTLAGVALLSCGCGVDYYRAETRLHSDGKIDRAIDQPVESVPEKARQAKLWQETRKVKEVDDSDWTGHIADLPAWTGDEEAPYFAGWNRFASVDEIPDHFVAQSPDESRQGRLVRELKQIDLVFVTEHHWHETLTDIVTLNDLHVASRELADLYTSYIDNVLTEGLGDDYDHKPLVAWLKGEGKQWFIELADVYYEAGALKLLHGGGGKEMQRRFGNVGARRGLKSDDNQAVEDFATAKLPELIRRKDGKPLDTETLDSILIWLFGKHVENEQGEQKTSPLDDVAKRVIAEKYGGKDAFALKLKVLASRIWGLYGPYTTPRQFDYSLQMPGTIVETSGEILADDRTQWSFTALEAYPLGYHMRSRSLEPNIAAMKKLLGGQPLASRESLLSYVRIVAGNDGLLTALNQCVQLQNMSPLKKYRAKVEADKTPPPRETNIVQIQRLWKLLKLPD